MALIIFGRRRIKELEATNDFAWDKLKTERELNASLREANERLGKRAAELVTAAEKAQSDTDALHGYALDLDAQLSDLTMFCEDLDTAFNSLGTDYEGEVNRSVRAAQSAITTISALPCASRISKDHWKLVQAAINAIPIRFTAPDAQAQNEPTADAVVTAEA